MKLWCLRSMLAGARASRVAGASLAVASMVAFAVPADADAERGRQLAAQYQCGRCHTIPGVASARGTLAIPLAAFGRRSYIAGHVPNTDALLQRWLIDPPALVPGTTMPAMGVTPPDARDLAAYLRSLR
jgi:cytochrome c